MQVVQNKGLLGIAVLVILSACTPREELLTGQRLDIRTDAPVEAPAGTPPDVPPAGTVSGTALEIALPTPQRNASWTHKGGRPSHAIAHVALGSSLTEVFRTDIGAAETRRLRITADPVSDGRAIYTLDASLNVVATGLAGERLWSRNLTPAGEAVNLISGGGLALGDGTLFVTTAFGRLVALDPTTGAELWNQSLSAAATAAPTVLDELVYVVSRDNTAWAIETDNGRVRWQLPSLPSLAGVAGGSAPAVGDRLVIFPFSSGEVLAAFRRGGVELWSGSVPGQRKGEAYAQISDFSADPVLTSGRVYLGTSSGRTVALDAADGSRIWTAEEGAFGSIVPVRGSVFILSDRGALVRLDATDGSEIWRHQLAYFEDARANKRQAVAAHYGPVLAGGTLVVASDDGKLRRFDPATGAMVSHNELPGGAASAPIVVNGTVYVVSTLGNLHAFR